MFSWCKCLIVNIVFSPSRFLEWGSFSDAPFPDRCLLVPFHIFPKYSASVVDPIYCMGRHLKKWLRGPSVLFLQTDRHFFSETRYLEHIRNYA